MFDLIVLVVPFASSFGEDVLFPGVALVAVLLLIANSLLQKWGYSLW